MVSSGLHMTELTTKWKQMYPNDEISVFVAENSRSIKNYVKFDNDEYKDVKINRVRNWGRHHGTLFQRFLFALGFSIKSFLFLLRNKKRFEVILITTNPPFLGILMIVINKILKLPYVLVVYDIYPQILSKLNILSSDSFLYKCWVRINVKVYNNASKIISIGRDMTGILENEMKIDDKSKIILIHNWADARTVYPVLEKNNQFIINNNLVNKKVLLYSGTLGSTHNIEDILKSASELSTYEEILFLFIGSGSKVKLVENYILFSGNHNVKLLDFQPIETLSYTLSSAFISFVCLDSSFTGLSVPSKSYGILASGVPIVGLIDSNSEIALMINEHNCGVVWNKRSKKTLSQVILDLVNDQIKLDQYKKNALNAFINNFQIDISVEKYKTAVNSILK
jgi:glycosyltransferase involved in cell wall biosynthesis